MEGPVHSGWLQSGKFQIPSVSEVVEKTTGGGVGCQGRQEVCESIHPHFGNFLAAPTQTGHTNTHDPAIPLGVCPTTH